MFGGWQLVRGRDERSKKERSPRSEGVRDSDPAHRRRRLSEVLVVMSAASRWPSRRRSSTSRAGCGSTVPLPGRLADNSQPTSRDVDSLVPLDTSRDSAVSGLKHAADGFSKLPLTGSAVPVLYLDLGFLANLADGAIQFVQIVREFEGAGRPTPAASNSHNLLTGSPLRAGAVPACAYSVPKRRVGRIPPPSSATELAWFLF